MTKKEKKAVKNIRLILSIHGYDLSNATDEDIKRACIKMRKAAIKAGIILNEFCEKMKQAMKEFDKLDWNKYVKSQNQN